MKTARFSNPPPFIIRKLLTLCVLAAVVTGSFVAAPSLADGKKKPSRLTEDQRIIHVLNRLGFGARPGDLERVKSMGLENYIKQQLNPENIADTLAENKVASLTSINMTTAQLYEKYPQPGQLLRQLQARGVLPSDLAEARENRTKANSQTGEMAPAEMTPAAPANKQAASNPQDDPKYRQAIREYYLKNGLEQPQRIVTELQASRILRAVYSERQLQEVMVDFWSNHFNIFAGKGADRWLLPAYDRDTIRPNALGKFSTLLEATAKSPAMLFYLDNFQSVSPNANRPNQDRPRRGLAALLGGANRRPQQQSAGQNQQRPAAAQARRGINENYARELMELHTLGVDGGYSQKDVQEVARCFTGWTIFQPRGAGAAKALLGDAAKNDAGTFYFNPRTHDEGEKVVLGHKIPAGGGMKDGLLVLDILAHHPATAKFIATKLARHFVSDEPSPKLIERIAAAFTRSDGDIRETLKAIFFSPEFNSPEAYRAKIKRPFELVVSAIRSLGADTNGGPGTHQWIARMGEPLYGFQTPNGYSDSAESWMNTGGLLERMNFGLALASNRVQGTRVDLQKLTAAHGATDKNQLMDQALKTILAGDISPETRNALLLQVDQPAVVSVPTAPNRAEQPEQMTAQLNGPRAQRPRVDANVNDPVTKTIGLILGTPEFQRQ
ncbi:MAG TPA: DUF1800 domain-containing protein [Pyrinomonadaceae bacterium]|nr:DUF1800 domain-containing protein [Pyrinomonadaceae bacterium]